ncbi:hypothetical protein ANCCAN_09584 [Ancylostoma caninum]|uniref:VWFA domain-containing protein n=1 Tax=Ancylostoma caninum TaxID=29170 RepID=A0A368GNE8_ANCCA|nr:hypothetical protein ANCCAN_09584 [Ancylostoma caninum]
MLEKETTKHKIMMIFSDTQGDTVSYPVYDQEEEADKARANGIRIIYVGVDVSVDSNGKWTNSKERNHAVRLTGSEENLIGVGDPNRLDIGILDNFLAVLCNPVL